VNVVLAARLTLLSLALLVAGCGGSTTPVQRAAVSRHDESYRDSDDEPVLAYGHPAAPAEARLIGALAKRYYAAAATGDGERACALTSPGLRTTIPGHYEEELGSTMPMGRPVPRDAHDCAAVLSALFERLHAELSAPVAVTGVRVKGVHGYALVGSPTLPASSIVVTREGGSWMIDSLLGQPVP
jgi:hypothetical protein